MRISDWSSDVCSSDLYDTNGDGINDTFVGVTSNAGKATITGVEFEGNAVLAEAFAGLGSTINLAATAGYIAAKYARFVAAFGTDVASPLAFQNTPTSPATATVACAHTGVRGRAVDPPSLSLQ